MADKFGGQKDGRQTTGATFYDVPAETVNANALYFPNFPASPFFGVAEYPVAAGNLGAFSAAGVFVFNKPADWINNPGRKVFYRPKTAATGEIVAQEIKGDVFIGYQILDNINPQKLGVLLAPPEFCMNILIVTSTADSGAGSLRQAIADASDGDVILFDSDVFPVGQTTSILLSSYITVNKSVSIYGGFSDGAGGYTSGAVKSYYVYREVEGVRTKVVISSPDDAQDNEAVLFENVCRVAIDGQNATRALYATTQNKDILVAGISVNNCWSENTSGGAVYLTYNNILTFVDCRFNNCESPSQFGGAIYSTADAQLSTINCSFVDCTAKYAGAITCYLQSVNLIDNCAFDSCSCTDYGGAFYCFSTSINTIRNCRFYGCSSNSNGGIIYATSESHNEFNNCSFIACNANNGGACFITSNARTTFTNVLVKDCAARIYGGGFYLNTAVACSLNACVFDSCEANNSGGGVYSNNTGQYTLTDCVFDSCSANYGGALESVSSSINTLNNCSISNCTATTGGGAVYSAMSSQNTLNDCTFDGCSANNGGGLYSANTSKMTLNNCVFDSCSATSNGGGGFIYGTSQGVFVNCSFTNCSATNGGGLRISDGSTATLDACSFDATSTVVTSNGGIIVVEGGITTVVTAELNSATITIDDGAALTITDSATIGAATFTSAGRGYLAVAAGIDTSAATLSGVVLCSYGAGLESFAISADGATWTADDLTTPILIETRDAGGDWQTLTDNATGGEYATTFALESTARAFDGVAFFVATLPGYWQADAGAVDANDWSVKGFAAANSNGGGDADAAQGWTVDANTITPNA